MSNRLKKFIGTAGMILLILAGCLGKSDHVYAADKPWVNTTNEIFACGYPVLIEKGKDEGETAVKYDGDRNGSYETTLLVDTEGKYTLYGGDYGHDVESASITMKGGTMQNIFAGGKDAGVTGNAKILIKSGTVKDTVSGGAKNMYDCGATVNRSDIIIEGGNIGAAAFGGYVHAAEKPNIVNYVTLTVKGGNIRYVQPIAARTGAKGEITVKEHMFQILGGNVDGVAGIHNTYVIDDIFSIMRPVGKDGKTPLYCVRLYLSNDGSEYKNAPVIGFSMLDGTNYPLKDVSTNKDGYISVWVPLNASVTGVSADQLSFINNKDTLEATQKSFTTMYFSNLVKKPYNGYEKGLVYAGGMERSCINGLNYSGVDPYTISGDAMVQTEAGDYVTVFTLKSGLKWEDKTKDPLKIAWKVSKADYKSAPSLRKRDESVYQKGDGAVLDVTESMEYSTDQKKWTSLKGKIKIGQDGRGSLNDLKPGTYYFRYAGNKNYNPSKVTSVEIKAGVRNSRFLKFMSYDGSKQLDITEAKEKTGEYYKAYIPEKYEDYLIVEKPNGTEKDICQRYRDSKLNWYIQISDDTSCYLLAPTYLDSEVELDLTGDKELVKIVDIEKRTKEDYLTPENMDDELFLFYFWSVIYNKTFLSEFRGEEEITSEEAMEQMLDKTYYLTPYPAGSDRLTVLDKGICAVFYKNADIIPHISNTEEEGSVMKLRLEKIPGESPMKIKFIFSSLMKEGSGTVEVFSMGKTPARQDQIYTFKNPLRKVVINTSTLRFRYGKESREDNATEMPVTVEVKEKEILSANTDRYDPEGSTQSLLFLRQGKGKVKKNSIQIKWKALKDADGYIIYGSKCGKNIKMRRMKEIKKSSANRCTFRKLKKDTYYKYLVVAYRNTAEGPKVLTTSKTVHIATEGGRHGNPKQVRIKKKKLSVQAGKTVKIKAKVVAKDKKKINTHISGLRFESLDPQIATVDKKGKVKGVSKGETQIIVYAQNGICQTLRVSVK